MMMLKLSMERVGELFSAIANQQALYLPIESADQVNFEKWSEGRKVRLDVLKTVKSGKDLSFPQSENLVAFKMEGKSIEIIQQELSQEKFVLMGVRPCDAKSFEILDKVFLAEPQDSYYAARRANGTVIAMACGNPEETCFCKNFGIDAADPVGDVAIWIHEGNLYWKSQTEKGEALTQSVKSLFSEAQEAEIDAFKAGIREKIEQLPFSHLDLSSFTPDQLNEKFNSPQWKKLSQSCLGCGSCTFVCPTCQCYDIRDYDTGHGIQRYRCWDSCMYSDFTMMAHGTNRPTQLERFRQRFMHKLIYFPSNNDGMYSCVGCGRCVAKCPIHMNIVKVIKALGGESK